MTSNSVEMKECCEQLLNKQINLEFSAFYAYEQMVALFCSRTDIALQNFANFFSKEAKEELVHARKFMDYLIKRGGTFKPEPIPSVVDYSKFESALHLLKIAHKLELDVYASILNMHECSLKCTDVSLELLLSDFVEHQVNQIAKLAKIITRVQNMSEKGNQYFLENMSLD